VTGGVSRVGVSGGECEVRNPLVYLLLYFVRIMAKCGGLTPSKPAISEVQEICDLVATILFIHFL